MKKYIFNLMLVLFLIGCSDNKYPPEQPTFATRLNELRQEFGVYDEELILESFRRGVDTTQVFFNGRINGKLWIGCYDSNSKTKIFEWVEDKKLDTVFHLYEGYGETVEYKIESFIIDYPYYYDEYLIFILRGGGDIYLDSPHIIDLYFVTKGSQVKKYKSLIHSSQTGYGCYLDIVPWENSVFSRHYSIFSEHFDDYVCFSLAGDSLYTIKNSEYLNIQNLEPVSIEEHIHCRSQTNTNEFFFQRFNLKADSVVWESKIKSPFEIIERDRQDSVILQKNSTTWDYSFFYTTFAEGKKYSIHLTVDVESGDIAVR